MTLNKLDVSNIKTNGARIRYLRNHLGYNITQFAQILGCSTTSLSKYEKDETRIPSRIRGLLQSKYKLDLLVPSMDIKHTTTLYHRFRQLQRHLALNTQEFCDTFNICSST